MGYYPPYFPDTYLQIMRNIPSTPLRVHRVEALVKSNAMRDAHLYKRMIADQQAQDIHGKGFYFDRYA